METIEFNADFTGYSYATNRPSTNYGASAKPKTPTEALKESEQLAQLKAGLL